MTFGRFFRLAACAALVAAATAESCGPLCILDDCVEPANGLDGQWPLATINGALLSTYRPGFKIPDKPVYLQFGTLNFTSTIWDENEHNGEVRLSYVTVSASSNIPISSSYVGVFEYHPQTGELVLRVDGQTGVAHVTGTTITASGILPSLGPSIVTFTKSKGLGL